MQYTSKDFQNIVELILKNGKISIVKELRNGTSTQKEQP